MLALQGAFREHREVLDALGVEAVEVRTPEQLGALDALILPGGESTTMSKLLDTSALRAPLAELLADGLPVLGTCAGMILLARDVVDGRPDQVSFGAIDVAVRRNAYGRQRDSFEAPLDGRRAHRRPVPGRVHPRAAHRARRATASRCSPGTTATRCSRARARSWVASFHPELSGDLRLHERFLRTADRR